jgi:hypothetical protein
MDEAANFIQSLGHSSGYGYVANLSKAEVSQIATSCDGIPLAIRWTLAGR